MRYLLKKILILNILIFLVNSTIFALPTDVNESNRSDGFDLILFSRAKGATPSSPNWIPEADINNDEIIDEKDLEYFTIHFARKGVVSSLWVSDYNNNNIVKLSGKTGKELLRVGGFLNPFSIAVNPLDGSCWVSDYGNNSVVKLDANGNELIKIGGFNKPQSIAYNWRDGSCWVGEYNNVVKLSSNGEILFRVSGLLNPSSLDIDLLDGSCWIADYDHNQVVKLNANGVELVRKSGFNKPVSVSVDQNDGSCWIADKYNNQIVKLISTGTTELIRIGGFNRPNFISINWVDESIWIADYENNQVVRLDKNGAELVRVSGFIRPISVSADTYDYGCWVADYESNQIVKLSANGIEVMRISGFNRPNRISLVPEEIKPDAPYVEITANKNRIDTGEVIAFNISGYDMDGYIQKYEIDFEGDGIFDTSLDTAGSIFYIYGSSGIKNAVVKATDNSWLQKYDNKIIRVGKLVVQANANPVSGNAPLTVDFSAVLFDPADGRVKNYQWDFDGDGIFEYLSTISGTTSFIYQNIKTYQATVKVTDTDGATAIDSVTVTVSGSPPTAKASVNPSQGTVPLTVNLSSSGTTDPDGFISLYQWDFNTDGVFDWSSILNGEANYTYPENGIYNPGLKVTDNSGLSDSSYCTVIVNQSPPGVQAGADPTSGNAPFEVNFNGTGTDIDGQIVLYEWDYGDGNEWNSDSTGISNHIYNSAGVYNAVFKVTDNENGIATTSVPINVFPSGNPYASASVSPDFGLVPLDVSFSGIGTDSDGQIVKYEWDFGDGNIDSTAITNHTYDSWGNYTASFKVTDNDGLYSTAGISIKVQSKPIPDLQTNVIQGNTPIEIYFICSGNDPDGNIVKYELDFEGDEIYDIISTANINISNIYQNSGIYSPVLKVTDNDGYFNTASVTISVDRSFPFIQLLASPQKGNLPLSVSFKANSLDQDGSIALYEWDFDGDDVYDSSTDFDSLVYVYDSIGNYHASVRVTDNDNLTAESFVNIEVKPEGSPEAIIYPSQKIGSLPLYVYFSGEGTDPDGNIVMYEFDFNGDGFYDTAYESMNIYDSTIYIYETPGIYSAVLKVTDNDGLTDYDSVQILVSSASLWVADHRNNQVVKLGIDGKELIRLSGFNLPYTVSVNTADGSCWVADYRNYQVVKLNSSGQELFRVGFNKPTWVSVNSSDGSCWVADESNHQIVKLSAEGQKLFIIRGFYYPHSVSVNTSDGSCWVTDGSHDQIVKLSSDGVELIRIEGFNNPMDVSVNSYDSSCWVSNANSGQIIKLDSDGQELFRINGFNAPFGRLVVNPADGSCWFADKYNHRIIRLDKDGKLISITAGFNLPEAVYPDIDGGCWVADTYGGKIVKLSANGTRLFDKTGFSVPTSLSFDPGTRGLSLPEAIAAITPPNGDKPLTVSFSATAIDTTASIVNYEWDFEGDGVFDFSASTESEVNISHTYSSVGIYNPVLRVTNSDKLYIFDYKNIVRVGPAFVNISQTITTGNAPLSVDFTASAFSPNGFINKYEWDFNGDGVYDWNSSTTGNTNYTYSQMGTYQPIVKITDNTGTELIKWASEIIVNQSIPVPVLNVSPVSGNRPLNILFNVAGSYDFDGSITLYEIDYNNDGVYDWNSRTPDDVGYIYNSAGVYYPVLKVTDNERLFSTTNVSVTVDPIPLTVTAQASPVRGKPPLDVSFSGSAGSDYPITLYEWNFGDGHQWSSNSTGITSHIYNSTGVYNAKFKVTDSGERYATAYVGISVLPLGNPEANVSALPTSGDTPLKVDFTGSGTDSDGQIVNYEWDFDGNGTYDWNSNITGVASYTYNNVGSYNAVFRVTDNTGLAETTGISIFAGIAPISLPQAYPVTGFAPLTVIFTPNGSDGDGTLINYQIDYDGNGIYDYSRTIPERVNYTYKIPGIYQAKLRVTDNNGLKGEGIVTINVQVPSIPTVSAQAVPVQGVAPLSVSFSGLASDLDGTLKRFEWDFDGNGIFDLVSESSAVASYIYETIGVYSACLKVTDNDNNFNTSSVLINVTSSPPPQITANASPENGTAPLKVTFTVSAVDTTSQIVKYEWDFNGDNTYDWSSDTTGNVSYTYTLANDYTAMFRATNSNNVSSIKSIPITVNMGIAATLNSEAFDPVLGETIAINSVLTQPAKITLRIVDRNQNPVRTVISNINRDPGFYSDIWNGRDDNGSLVKVGIYYFIIDYEINGKTYSYNLTNTVGSYEVESFTYPLTFSPYDGKPCTLQYTLAKAAEITIYVWEGNPTSRIKTIGLREPQKKGTYVALWDGTNDEGIIAPSAGYILAILKWALAENAIIVSGRPIISDISLSTGYFSPNPDCKNHIRMDFRLSKPVKLKVLVRDDFGNYVNETEIFNVANGLQSIGWNGMNKNGFLATSGKYSLGVQAIDDAGNTSGWVYGVFKLFY